MKTHSFWHTLLFANNVWEITPQWILNESWNSLMSQRDFDLFFSFETSAWKGTITTHCNLTQVRSDPHLGFQSCLCIQQNANESIPGLSWVLPSKNTNSVFRQLFPQSWSENEPAQFRLIANFKKVFVKNLKPCWEWHFGTTLFLAKKYSGILIHPKNGLGSSITTWYRKLWLF